MTLIVEDGTGKSDAESYASVAYTDAHMLARGMSIWAGLAEIEKEQALRRATAFMQQVYRLRWKGERKTENQALDWPRIYVERADYGRQYLYHYTGYLYYPDDTVPGEVQSACADLALKAAAGDLYPEEGQSVKREKVGPLEVEYQDYTTAKRKFPAITGLLSPLMKAAGTVAIRA
jgi:hypothetical protein